MKKGGKARGVEAVKEIEWWPFFQTVLILIAGYLAVAPALHGGWLWDDDRQITANMALRSGRGLWEIWFAPVESDYFPLKSTVLWGLWHLWGGAPLGYRVFSLCCHLVSALLVWRLLDRLGLRWGWLGGMIFAVHPQVVESVAWISEIKNTLSLPLLLASMLLYLEYDERKGRADLAWSVGCFLAAMLCKSTVVMLPGVLLLYCWWKRGGVSRRDLWSAIPYAVIAVALGCVTVWFQETRAIGADRIVAGGILSRFVGAGVDVWFYLWKFIAPVGLSPIYPRWSVEPPTIVQLLSVPMIAVVVWWCWTQRNGWGRHALLGLGFFLLNLLPVLGFLKMSFMSYSWVSDHFVYLPMIGLIGLVVAAAQGLFDRLPASLRMVEQGVICVGLVLMLAASGAHAAVFRGEEAMWQDTLRLNPAAFVAHDSLGAVYIGQGRLPEAVAHIQQALEIKPDYAKARYNLGCANAKQGRLADAIAQYQQALKLDAGMVEARNNLGEAELRQGKLPEAVAAFRAAIALEPGYAEAHNNLGIALIRQGDGGGAVEQFQTAVKINPDYDEAYLNLGIAQAKQGKISEAIQSAGRALRINPGNAKARAVLQILGPNPAR